MIKMFQFDTCFKTTVFQLDRISTKQKFISTWYPAVTMLPVLHSTTPTPFYPCLQQLNFRAGINSRQNPGVRPETLEFCLLPRVFHSIVETRGPGDFVKTPGFS